MCLIVFGKNIHKDFPLILVANRDEFFNRPTLPLHHWENYNVIAGKDLTANGTWLGVNENGKIAAITNYRDPKNVRQNAPSRGILTLEYLKSNDSPLSYIEKISKDAHLYNGFNLLLGQKDELLHYSNISNKTTSVVDGIHGLSNALLNTPWPKVDKAKAQLKAKILSDVVTEDELIGILSDRTFANETELPDTGIDKELEKKLSSMFINIKGYGTRCTSLILMDKEGKFSFTELLYDENGRINGKNSLKT